MELVSSKLNLVLDPESAARRENSPVVLYNAENLLIRHQVRQCGFDHQRYRFGTPGRFELLCRNHCRQNQGRPDFERNIFLF